MLVLLGDAGPDPQRAEEREGVKKNTSHSERVVTSPKRVILCNESRATQQLFRPPTTHRISLPLSSSARSSPSLVRLIRQSSSGTGNNPAADAQSLPITHLAMLRNGGYQKPSSGGSTVGAAPRRSTISGIPVSNPDGLSPPELARKRQTRKDDAIRKKLDQELGKKGATTRAHGSTGRPVQGTVGSLR